MAEILKAKDGSQAEGPIIAVKRILPHLTEDQQFVTMFRDESRVLAQLHHDNIIETFEVGEVQHQPYIAIEYVFGQDARMLFHRSRRDERTVPIPVACYIIAQVCAGLHYAHEQTDDSGALLGLVHRDVSLQNVLLSYDGAVKLTDFGIAMSAENVARTEAGIVKGKFGYMSPEQIRGEPLDRRSDVFATGICLYELLTSERLFSGESDYAAVERVRNVDIDPPSRFNRQIPSALEAIVMKALAKHPRDRYQSAADLRQALLGFMQESHNECSAGDLASYLRKAFAEELRKQPTPETLKNATTDSHAEGTGLAAFDNLDPISTVSSLHDPMEPQPEPAPEPLPGASQVPHRGLGPAGQPSVPPLVPRRESIPPSHRQQAAAAAPISNADIEWHDDGQVQPLPDVHEPGDDDVTRQVHIDQTMPGSELADSGIRGSNPVPQGNPSPFAPSPTAGAISPAAAAVTPVVGSVPPAAAVDADSTSPVRVSGGPQGPATMPASPQSAPLGRVVMIVVAIVLLITAGVYLSRGSQPGVVHLTTQPRSVKVEVDGVPVTTTSSPFVLADLNPDQNHRIEVSKDGFAPWTTTLMVRSGQTLELPLVELEPIAAAPEPTAGAAPTSPPPAAAPAQQATAEAKPSATEAAGEPTAAAPEQASAPKAPEPRAPAAKSKPKPKPKAKAKPKAKVKAAAGFGTLRLNSRPWSEVSIDGRRVGNTPQMNLRLSAGTHTIKLVNPQFGLRKTVRIKIKAGETVTKIVSLQ